jgi:hypothetical protein
MHHLALLGLDLPAEGVLDVGHGLATLLNLLPTAVASLLPDRRAQLFLVCYTLFCLLPTCMAAALLVTYFNSELLPQGVPAGVRKIFWWQHSWLFLDRYDSGQICGPVCLWCSSDLLVD